MPNTSIVLAGVGGYGGQYVAALTDRPERDGLSIAGVVDPFAQSSRHYGALRALGVPFFDTLDQFYAGHAADLAIISTPIALHADMAIQAMRCGSDVLVEKPAAGSADGARAMIASRDATGRKLAVGFQWCYDAAMLRLKRDIDAGRLGRVLWMRSLVLWPRDRAYYGRGTGWAGREYDGQGRPIFDSVASNATAHYLENLLWLAGPDYRGASIESMIAHTGRANDIETYDTIALCARLAGGGQLYFAASHAAGQAAVQDPTLECAFERATVRLGGLGLSGGPLTARFADGAVLSYGQPDVNGMAKLWTMIDAMRGDAEIPCPAEAGLAHAEAIEMARRACPMPELLGGRAALDGDTVWVPGLGSAMIELYDRRAVPGSFADLL
ncbi:MAG: Gfo/Idh/MocA family oxidoreductase [Clostridiales bacterium]|nr:Gfo/Idh/MocA family oxidoreductase [Clostridiales bacterium]